VVVGEGMILLTLTRTRPRHRHRHNAEVARVDGRSALRGRGAIQVGSVPAFEADFMVGGQCGDASA
jgi:hypothetical protein